MLSDSEASEARHAEMGSLRYFAVAQHDTMLAAFA